MNKDIEDEYREIERYLLQAQVSHSYSNCINYRGSVVLVFGISFLVTCYIGIKSLLSSCN